jgi:flagellar L-ring protein FlgH
MKVMLTVLPLFFALCGCNSSMREVGRLPELSDVNNATYNSQQFAAAIPPRPATPLEASSTWSDGASRLFTSGKALREGDVLTVTIFINDKAQLTNQSDRSRKGNKSLGLSASGDVNGANAAASATGSLNSSTDFTGGGGISRSESIRLSVAAVVDRVLENGNLMIRGSQEVRVNAELRVLTIAGVARPSDINPDNTIPYERIAEARVSYGGRGRISEVQQPPYGQQALDMLLPL